MLRFFLRLFVQIGVMAGDLMLFTVIAVLLAASHFNVIGIILSIACLRVWWKTGAFEAWTPKGIRAFWTNAKQAGL